MHTVDLLEQAIRAARLAGYKVREEWLGGVPGGGCEIHGSKWLFLDLALTPREQLDSVVEALAHDPSVRQSALPAELRTLLAPRRAA
jgi:hypothetical protein